MQETRVKSDGAEEEQTTENKNISQQTPNLSNSTSHESLWGAVLFACMLLFVVASIGGVGWVAYTKWRSERVAKSQPSIAVLSGQKDEGKSTASTEPVSATDAVSVQNSSVSDSVVAAKKLEISVLNGGGVKGSASTLASFLKTEGYGKTVTGNTVNNYTGVVIYYATGLEKEAGAVKESVAKKYPQAKILPADMKNKETIVSQVTIILGK